ncbi:HAD-IC family P-type ATPase [Saccharopolyspora phatthalungensis]|uniref:P-type E1-E2 ATPase n=1 Tax=Saccharopolyspora phatthalungensis TaxID=664693 RepID=A0A840QC61_9PSEU|nr:HAD-IC family P-type ATPase [Saccharopolyspora phatthalungensis]MBB5157547.1 P-type E1-E2 ATPase [Saccharopolyspora phatthalungensis]
MVRQLHYPLVYLLLVAGAVALAFGEGVDASVIFGVVLLNTAVGFVQESKAEAALDALRAMVRTHARVVREWTVPSEDLVPGDVVLVGVGDKVPADLRLIRLTNLRVDESALTGESVPVVKDEVTLPEMIPVATGAETELGKIHRLVGAAEELATPLTRKLS